MKLIVVSVFVSGLVLMNSHIITAQATNNQVIVFDSFNATYRLSRDAQNRSLLTTEEVILAGFPAGGSYTGITRTIPQNYQNNDVKVKVLNVLDTASRPLPFKTTTDKDGNLVLSTGDPAILVYGTQTFRINYQTRDVINIKSKENEFLLTVNGRGWSQPFNKVAAVVHIPSSFHSNITATPECYMGYGTERSSTCEIISEKKADETVITAKSLETVKANQSLVIKILFKDATFAQAAKPVDRTLIVGGIATLIIAGILIRKKNKI